ncbi:MAG: tetratricopeptide repeat protein [Lachnospiraceae bacterium]|nr:tetratricopeptide repeat protein [Lachnospiraceae bacterium]
MKKTIIASVYVLVLLVSFKLAFTYLYNESIIDDYEENDYSSDVDPLLFANWIQPYLAHYNMGNIHYQNKDYQSAIEEYNQALEENPSKEQECSVRINLALAMIATLGEDYDSEENVEASIEKLTEARNVLLQDGCATENGDGHSETAEKLKKEIDDLLDELKKNQTSQPNNSNDPQDNPDDPQNGDDYEQDIKQKLQQQQNQSYQERNEMLNMYDEFDSDMNFDADGRVW